MRIQEIVQIYTDFSGTYDADVKRRMRYTAYIKAPKLVIKHLNSKAARILDLGCGTGLSSLLFFEAGHQVTGIDGARAMIERARKLPFQKLISQNLEKPLRVKDLSFDAAVMIGVMEYIDDPAAVLAQVARKLRPGGVFGLTFPRRSSWYTKFGLKSYYKKEVEPMMREAGFTIIECERILGIAEYGRLVHYLLYVLKRT
jgi:ubiquinone/menaquinone biosynthesis C-methylase UbiE